MRAEDGKFHIIYKTTNLVDGTFYIGRHSTRILEDEYLGSGTHLRRAVKKYGKSFFKRDILEFAASLQSLKIREKEIVNEELLCNPQCINLRKGGDGWDSFEASAMATKRNIGLTGTEQARTAAKKSVETRRSRGIKPWGGNGVNSFLGRNHSESTLAQMRASQRKVNRSGENHHMFGKRFAWINKDKITIRIALDKLDSYLTEGWKRGICK